MSESLRHLVLVLGDQLDRESSAFDGFDPACDRVVMAEVAEEATHVWSHKARIALFLSAMRHFAQWLGAQQWPLTYLRIGDHPYQSLEEAIAALAACHRPQRLIVCKPGDWRVQEALTVLCSGLALTLEVREDRHFFSAPQQFAHWARDRKTLRLEYFYRELRQRHCVLMDGRQPCGDRWSFDTENRSSFGARGPTSVPLPQSFAPDEITLAAIEDVANRYSDHPGQLHSFDWPVTAEQAELALDDFIAHRLADFGRWQDAMWSGHDWLYHSRLSAAMNLKLIAPRRVVARVEHAYRSGAVSISAAEGFIRQILGWREYVRGLYWLRMPGYLEDNALHAEHALPEFYWTGNTDMNCLRQTIQQTLRLGYAHHIQRLMVTGLYALLLGVRPTEVHRWYLAVYVDAVEWVELPNTISMSQYADGGVMASKPYVASGKYIQRMSNYCADCRFDPEKASGENACPFTTLYWDFLDRHRQRLSSNMRMQMQLKNLDRKSDSEMHQIRAQATRVRSVQPE